MKNILIALALLVGLAAGQTKDRIARVESGLSKLVLVKELSSEGGGDRVDTWTIQERMKHYNIPGVSVAVIDGWKVAWQRLKHLLFYSYSFLFWRNSIPLIPVTSLFNHLLK